MINFCNKRFIDESFHGAERSKYLFKAAEFALYSSRVL